MSPSRPVRFDDRARPAGRISWPLRWWLLSFLIGVAVISFIALVILPLFMEDWDPPGPQLVKDRVVDEWEQWDDETWHVQLAQELQREGMEAELYDASGELLFRSESVPSPGPRLSRRWRGVNRRWVDVIEVFRDGSLVGRAHMAHRWLGIVDDRGLDWWAAATMLAVIIGSALLTSIAGIWLLSRTFLKPLRQLSVAAEQIRHGDLDVRFPRSGVREVGVLIDDFRRMTDGLRQSIGRQAAMEEERRFFLAAASHDLRSPLFALRGRLEGIRDGVARNSEEVDHYVRSALDRVGILERLVADLFMFSQVDVLEQEPAMEPLDLGRLIRKCVEDARVAALEKDVSVAVADDSSQPGDVLGDRHLLERAFDNLLSNALRHTPPGGEIEAGWRRVPINTSIGDGLEGSDKSMIRGGSRSGHIIEVWVADTGEGIPADVLPHIFDPLYRGEPSRSAQTGGMGLGLAIAKRVVEAHGGTLTALNRATGGAHFTMKLPAC